MRTEDEMFNDLKNSTDLAPRSEFIKNTRNNLIKQARKMDSKRQFKKNSYYFGGALASILLFCWLAFFDGTHFISASIDNVSSAFKIEGIKVPSSDKENDPITDQNTNIKDPEVFIYHTHNTESFSSNTDETDQYVSNNNNENVTAVGKKLAQSLNNKGVKALHDDSNINNILKEKGWRFSRSYEVSGGIVKDALNRHDSLKLVIDIHRDSQKRSFTTDNIDGQDVGRIALVVSKNSAKFEENKKIADLVAKKIEEKYPGLLRGVYIQEPFNDGTYENKNYNQDLFGNSLLLEVGGVENTLVEEYKTMEILSEVIKEVLESL